MATDDFDERRRESNDYLNRRQDRLDFEDGLMRQSAAVSKAIRKKDFSRAADELGIDPSFASGTDAEDSGIAGVRDRPQTAFGQFLTHSTRLIIQLESSRFLPNRVAQQWIRRIKQIDIFQPAIGLLEIDALYAEYMHAVEKYKPQRDVFDLAVSQTMEFEREMHRLKLDLDWIKVILKHVQVAF